MVDYAPSFTEGEMVGKGVIVTCVSGGAITKGRFVKLSSGTGETPTVVVCGNYENVFGVALKAAAGAGEYIPVLVRGIVKMTLGTVSGTLAAGSAVRSNANGLPEALQDQAVDEGGTATYTIYYNAKAGVTMQNGATGDKILILVGK